MIQTVIGAVIAVLLFLFMNSRKKNFKIGQKVYYYLDSIDKKYTGRITAIITCKRSEDVTTRDAGSRRRIISKLDRNIITSEYILYEIQPVLGGDTILLHGSNILEKFEK